jgi:signal transduction histidine kinase
LLLLSGGIFLASLVQLRKQWLSRQIALEHLSHSIKTPVARLRLNSDTLLESRVVSPEVERSMVQAIGRECGRLERAVQNAALAIQEGGLKPHFSAFNLSDLLSELKEVWQPAFTQHHIALELDAPDEATGSYDRDLVLVMLDNLIDNALRHSRLNHETVASGRAGVTIRLTQESQNITLQICDTGTGIHPKDLKRIFRRFERGKDKALSDVSGLGLGLTLSKEIAEVHGGKIVATNNPQGGACFTVTLPREHTS